MPFVRIEVKKAAAQCVKGILATQAGVDFWDLHKSNRDPMLAYLNPFRTAKNKVEKNMYTLPQRSWQT